MRGLRSSYFHIATVTDFGVLKYSLSEFPPKEGIAPWFSSLK
jgi:hypothetical protein